MNGADMTDKENHLYGKNSENLQVPYDEYIALKEKAEEAQRLQDVKMTVLADLQRLLGAEESFPQHRGHAQRQTIHLII